MPESPITRIVPRLDPLIRRLATDHDGERLAVVDALGRVLRSAGLGFHDLADAVRPTSRSAPPPPPPEPTSTAAKVRDLLDSDWLSGWEREFLESIEARTRFRSLTAKQQAVLDRLWARR